MGHHGAREGRRREADITSGEKQVASAESLKRRTFFRALAGAVLLATALIALQLFSHLPIVDHSPDKTGAINPGARMLIVGCLIAVWGFSVQMRCSDAAIRRYFIAIAVLFILWLLDVIIKHATDDDFWNSVYWYLFYVPLLFTPTLFLFSALRAATLDRVRLVRILKPLAVAVNISLLLLVFTNNIHHQVFVFTFDDPDWSRNYTYAWGYWLIFGWCVFQFVAFIATLFIAARRQLHSAFLPLVVIAAMGIVYGLLYALRVGNVMSSNFTLTFIIIVTVAMEVCLDLGLLPSYVRYGEAFEKLPFDVKILTHGFQTAFSTDCAKSLTPEVRAAVENASKEGNGSASFKVSGQPTTLFKLFSIAGGTVLFTSDVSGIVERRKRLEQRRDALRRRNRMLERNRTVQGRLYRQKAEGELLDELDRSLGKTTVQIREILDTLPTGEDEESRLKRRNRLALVKLLVAYCKRKGSLVLDRKDDPEFERGRLQLIVNETSADLRTVGIDCAAIVEVDDVLPAATASVLYDCLYDFAIEAFFYDNPALMFYIHDKGSRHIEMSAVMEKANKEYAGHAKRLTELHETLETRNVAFRLDDSKDRMSLTVIASREGF